MLFYLFLRTGKSRIQEGTVSVTCVCLFSYIILTPWIDSGKCLMLVGTHVLFLGRYFESDSPVNIMVTKHHGTTSSYHVLLINGFQFNK